MDAHHEKCIETRTYEQKWKIIDSLRPESWPDGSRKKIERCQFGSGTEAGQEKAVSITERGEEITLQDNGCFVEQSEQGHPWLLAICSASGSPVV